MTFALVVGIVGTVIIGLVAAIVVRDLWTGKIDLSQLLSDSNQTSLSRFQFLVFTFIIGLSYLLFAIAHLANAATATLPDVPAGVMGLLGISAGSYVLGKGIEKAAQTAGQPPPSVSQQSASDSTRPTS
jgi:uncharacterized BrkB/YihY/UPF0761 family membrane protein